VSTIKYGTCGHSDILKSGILTLVAVRGFTDNYIPSEEEKAISCLKTVHAHLKIRIFWRLDVLTTLNFDNEPV